MATVFTAIGTAVSSATAAAGSILTGAGTAAAGTGAAAAGTGAVTLSKVLSAGSALAAIGQGFAAKQSLEDQAAFAEAEAEQEEALGASKARDLAREYAELTGEQKVIQLANGLDIGVGTPVSVSESTKRFAQRNIDTTRKNADNRAAMARLRSRGLMTEAKNSLLAGFGSAGTIGADAYQLTG